MNQCQDDWYEWLSIAELTYNDQIHASMHSSPFMLDTRQNPRLGIEPLRKSHLETLNNSTSWMEAVTKEVHLALTRAADNMAHFHDAHCRVPTKCSQGQGLAQQPEHQTTCSMKKLDHKWLGPYAVDKVISQNAYRQKLQLSFS